VCVGGGKFYDYLAVVTQKRFLLMDARYYMCDCVKSCLVHDRKTW